MDEPPSKLFLFFPEGLREGGAAGFVQFDIAAHAIPLARLLFPKANSHQLDAMVDLFLNVHFISLAMFA
jgi:hypothetical protein